MEQISLIEATMKTPEELHLTETEIKKQADKKDRKRLANRKSYAKNVEENRRKALEAYHKKRAEKLAAGTLPPPKKRGRPCTVIALKN